MAVDLTDSSESALDRFKLQLIGQIQVREDWAD